MGGVSVPTPALYPAFFFVLEKGSKSAGNAVIPTFPMHWPHGLQDLRHKRRNARFKGAHTPPHLLTAHTAAHRAKHGAFWMGVVSLPSERFARFGNPARPGLKTANFAAFGPWSGVLPKSAESLRDSDVLMRVAVPQASRPRWAALSLPVIAHRRALGVCHRCDKGQRTLLAGLLSFCLRCRGFFFSWYKISIAPEADMKPRRLCLFLL